MDTKDKTRLGINVLKRKMVAFIVEKMIEFCLSQFDHMRRRLGEASVRRVDQINISPIVRGKGRSRKTIDKTIKDLDLNGLFADVIHDRTQWYCLIHVVDPLVVKGLVAFLLLYSHLIF